MFFPGQNLSTCDATHRGLRLCLYPIPLPPAPLKWEECSPNIPGAEKQKGQTETLPNAGCPLLHNSIWMRFYGQRAGEAELEAAGKPSAIASSMRVRNIRSYLKHLRRRANRLAAPLAQSNDQGCQRSGFGTVTHEDFGKIML